MSVFFCTSETLRKESCLEKSSLAKECCDIQLDKKACQPSSMINQIMDHQNLAYLRDLPYSRTAPLS